MFVRQELRPVPLLHRRGDATEAVRPKRKMQQGRPDGRPVVSLRFLDLLTDLAPSSPRLALAMACAKPWRDCAAELPECYRVELDHAGWVAHAEHNAWHARGRPGEGKPDTPIIDLDHLFAEEPELILSRPRPGSHHECTRSRSVGSSSPPVRRRSVVTCLHRS
jgi:hypothetical protein